LTGEFRKPDQKELFFIYKFLEDEEFKLVIDECYPKKVSQ